MNRKKLIVLGTCIFLQGLFVHCTNKDDNEAQTIPTIQTIQVDSSLVEDASGVELGRIVKADMSSVVVLNSSGYMFELAWSGVIKGSRIYYSNADCTGTPYYSYVPDSNVSNRFIYKGFSNFFIILGADTDVNGYTEPSDFTFASHRYFDTGMCNTFPSSYTNQLYELKMITPESVGIPAIIQPPIVVVY